MVLYGPVWSRMIKYAQLWSRVVLCSPVCSGVVPYGQLWSSMVQYGQVWSGVVFVVPYGPVWSRMVQNVPGSSQLVPYVGNAFRMVTSQTSIASQEWNSILVFFSVFEVCGTFGMS